MRTTILHGCDPEIFLRDKKTKEFASAYGRFPGTKAEPFKIERGAVQVDGMALEFNIDPVDNEKDFIQNIDIVLAQLNEMVRNNAPECEIAFEPYASFDPIYFMVQPFEPKLLGCEPDFDDNGTEKAPSSDNQDRPFRTAAGHYHIGFTKGQTPREKAHFEKCMLIAKAFKNAEGFVPVTTNEQKRTALYGKPGSFRPKSYGIELRSPSNRWVETREGRSRMFRTVSAKMQELAPRLGL